MTVNDHKNVNMPDLLQNKNELLRNIRYPDPNLNFLNVLKTNSTFQEI